LEQELINIREEYSRRLREREAEMEREFVETRRVLGFDQTAYLS
jgi:hypothetical protein